MGYTIFRHTHIPSASDSRISATGVEVILAVHEDLWMSHASNRSTRLRRRQLDKNIIRDEWDEGQKNDGVWKITIAMEKI